MSTLIEKIAQEASKQEQALLGRRLRSLKYKSLGLKAPPLLKSDPPPPVTYIGSVCGKVDANDVVPTGTKYWTTWRIQGERCLLIQMKPRKVRKRKREKSAGANKNKQVSPPFSKVYIVGEDDQKLYVCNPLAADGSHTKPPFWFERSGNAASKDQTQPSIIIQGVLCKRKVSVESDVDISSLRKYSMNSLLCGENEICDVACTEELVFFATDYLLLRAYQGTKDFQSRMAEARIMCQGRDASSKPVLMYRKNADVHDEYKHLQSFKCEYKAHMAPAQADAIVCDVPDDLCGVSLCGIEFRNPFVSHVIGETPPTTMVTEHGFYVSENAATGRRLIYEDVIGRVCRL